MSIDETRARDELALLVSRFSRIGLGADCVVVEPDEIAGILIDPDRFARVAGLLGYVKVDVTGVENGVRYWEGDADRVGGQWERVIADFDDKAERKHFYLYCVRCAETWNAEKPGHRMPELVTRKTVKVPWEVVSDADS